MMFPKHSFHILKLLVVVFPVVAGLFLTSLGVVKLNQASEKPIPKPLAPYGILAFSSEELDSARSSLGFVLDDMKIKENLVLAKIGTVFCFLNSSTEQEPSHEVTFGFQVPYNVELLDCYVRAFSKITNSWIELGIKDENVIFVENCSTSLIYLKFVAPPDQLKIHQYVVTVIFHWRNFIIKRGFSTYDIIVPFSTATFNVANTYLPNVNPAGFSELVFGTYFPPESEIRETFPFPTEETMKGFATTRYILWSLGELGLSTEESGPSSKLVRIRLELPEESELRGRLMFDSGLYMGLGVSLIFSGVHEALKLTMELRRKRIE